MKKILMLNALCAALVVGVLVGSTTLQAQRRNTEEELWRLERVYIETSERGDAKGHTAFWHDAFSGWSRPTSWPIRAFRTSIAVPMNFP